MTPLRATVRLQLHADFNFDAVTAQLDYFSGLGISHLYLSPIAEAMPGSRHGYDGIDPTRISAALGGESGFIRLATAARAQAMGIILDIVPNHLAAHVDNPWWADVLKQGRRSPHAEWFDIDWEAPGCEGRLWLPVLDRPLDAPLSGGELRVVQAPHCAELVYQQQRWPLSSLGVPADPGERDAWITRCNQSPAHLQSLLDQQSYRLAWWRSGPDRVNYRRFFDINELAAMRVERAEVFEAMHALPLRLVREGWVDGLRIDHVDGLADPATYLHCLRRALDEAGQARALPAGAVSLHVEKILHAGESLPQDWPCDGTTGYDFMDEVGALLHEPAGEAALSALWEQASGSDDAFASVQRHARTELLQSTLQADVDRCLRSLNQAMAGEATRHDLTPRMYARAAHALLLHFPVYRTYGMRSAVDQQLLDAATTAASATLGAGDRAALQSLGKVLRGYAGGADDADDAVAVLRTRLEQLASPLNAKAVEDTAFYRYGRLLSRNEVGSDPAQFALPPATFIERARQRGERHPRALLAVATHDHKRGPDARLRLASLAAAPAHWQAALGRWNHACTQHQRRVPLPGAEAYMLWQTLLAAWPVQPAQVDAAFACRITEWLRKALREGKRLSGWSDPDEALERAAADWVDWLCTAAEAQPLRDDIQQVAANVARQAARLSLVQLALQLSCPGVPDIYQGNEGWDTSLVDPDNRRPVDYAQRRAWLADSRSWSALLQDWQDGAPKARLLAVLLKTRAAQPALFAGGSVHTIETGADEVLVLRRQWQQQVLLVAVQRRSLADATAVPPTGLAGGVGERLLQGAGVPKGTYRNLLSSQQWLHEGGEVCAGTLFDDSPVALWIREVEQHDDA